MRLKREALQRKPTAVPSGAPTRAAGSTVVYQTEFAAALEALQARVAVPATEAEDAQDSDDAL